MEARERILAMYIEAAERLHDATRCAEGTEQGSEERDRAERIYGERQAYGRILKELHGASVKDLQSVLDQVYKNRR